MDSLTAHHLARELHERWLDRRVTGSLFDREGRGVVLAVDGEAVRLDLSTPDVVARAARPAPTGGLLSGWSVRRVYAPLDDRRLVVELGRPGRFKGSAERRAALEVSMVPTARGAVLRDAGGSRLAAVGTKIPPAARARPPLDAATVEERARNRDVDGLLRGRWMSPVVARWLIAEPERAADRYQRLLDDSPARPAWCDRRLLPFPMCANAEPAPSLILPAGGEDAAEQMPTEGRRDRARRRMLGELDRAREAPRLREAADALMLLGDAQAPAEIPLADGSMAPTGARPSESALDAAARLYSQVRSMERALETLPFRLAALDGGEEESSAPNARSQATRRETEALPTRPYRTYRSSGGLEIWVGRGAASNEALTFRAASPEDIWLHARDAAGAHVVLRWQRPEPPPARDLEEAATLAAWHSKARGSTLVPVDWTRRKYVRKARGAAPGRVIVQRCQTIMARPGEGRKG